MKVNSMSDIRKAWEASEHMASKAALRRNDYDLRFTYKGRLKCPLDVAQGCQKIGQTDCICRWFHEHEHIEEWQDLSYRNYAAVYVKRPVLLEELETLLIYAELFGLKAGIEGAGDSFLLLFTSVDDWQAP